MFRKVTVPAVVVLIQLLLVNAAFGAAIGGPTNEWTALFYPTIDPDPINDHQTGQDEADIVGTSRLSGFFTQYEINDPAILSDDMLKFRLRLGTEETPLGFSHIAIIGLDGDLDGTNDAFIMLDNSGQDEIALYTTGNKANDSPKSTSTSSTSYSYTPDSTNYDWSPVSALNCSECTASDYDLDGDLSTDFYLSFSVPFIDIIAVLAMDGVTGITPSSLISYIAGTSTNTNSFNQDIVGIDGDPLDDTLPWSTLEAITLAGSIQPTPEPGTGTMLGLGLCWLSMVRKKRRLQASRVR